MIDDPDPVRLQPGQAAAYRELMLKAYELHPDAFTSALLERQALPLSWWRARLDTSDGALERVFGVLLDGRLAGVIGLRRSPGQRTSHKATLFGTYVDSAFRGAGHAHRLVGAALRHAHTWPGLRLLQLTVSEHNQAAIALYRRYGFIQYGLEPEAVAAPHGFVAKRLMWRSLQGSDETKPG